MSEDPGRYVVCDEDGLRPATESEAADFAGMDQQPVLPPSWRAARDKNLTRAAYLRFFFREHARHLKPVEIALMAYLVSQLNPNNGTLATMTEYLAQHLGIDRATISRALHTLEGDNPRRWRFIRWVRGKRAQQEGSEKKKAGKLGVIHHLLHPESVTPGHLDNLRRRRAKPAKRAAVGDAVPSPSPASAI